MRKKVKEKLKSWADATPEEKRGAFRMAGLWTSSELEGRTEKGAFSDANLGIPAVEYFPTRAYQTLKSRDCKWKWKEGVKLSTLMINVIKSDMAHVLRDYILDGEPDVMTNSEFERQDVSEDGYDDANEMVEIDPELRVQGFQVKSEMELIEELQKKELRRDAGYKIAQAAAKGDPKMEQYVELAFEQPDYRAISKKLKKTKPQVLEIEAELIAKIRIILQD